jgi:predicted nuclease of predicted toxin-antitoxin system
MAVSPRVVERLRADGHQATHLREQGLQRLPDDKVFAKAQADGSILLTFDLDFGEIVALSSDATVSVVVFRLRDTRTDRVIARLLDVITQSSDALQAGAVVVVEDSRHRVRHLPVAGSSS